MAVRSIAISAALAASVWSPAIAGAASPVPAAVGPGTARTLSRVDLRELAEQVSHERGLDFKLVDAVITVESGYNPAAVSHKGAQGLMQLMPDTARRLRVGDPFDPEQNLRGGVEELDRLIGRYSGNLQLALAAYNAGEGAVERYRGIPPYRETRDYVARIMSLYTGRPYRVTEGRLISPVRMTRDDEGRTVITNTSAGETRALTVARTGGGQGTLRGGFGSR